MLPRRSILAAMCIACASLSAQQPASPRGMPRPTSTAPVSSGALYVQQIPPLPAASASELRDLVSRYSADRAALLRRFSVEHSPERRAKLKEFHKVNPFFLGGEVIQVSYPTDTMDHADKLMSMKGNALHFSRATVQHELIPGHHLQGFMTDRYSPHRAAFGTPFWSEGWYQVAYMIGGLQFRALHRELVGSGRMTDRAFHDAILKLGRMPVEMVRASLTPQPLARDHRAQWKFYDGLQDRTSAVR